VVTGHYYLSRLYPKFYRGKPLVVAAAGFLPVVRSSLPTLHNVEKMEAR